MTVGNTAQRLLGGEHVKLVPLLPLHSVRSYLSEASSEFGGGGGEVAAYAGEREAFFFMFVAYYTAALPILGAPSAVAFLYFVYLDIFAVGPTASAFKNDPILTRPLFATY